jgi:hypothetical protein
MKSLTTAIYLPLDARPVCFQTPKLLMKLAGIMPLMPHKTWLGNLKQPANLAVLIAWLETLTHFNAPVIASLDLMSYGGLIPSRIGLETEEAIRQQLSAFYGVLVSSIVYGYSAVLRIPAYNNAEEEPDYWASYGEALHQFSFNSHQAMKGEADLPAWPDSIPVEVVADFLHRRHRNFEINEYHLHCLKAGLLQTLVFCEDDRAAYGLNVAEAAALQTQSVLHGLTDVISVQTGADEVGHCLLAKHLTSFAYTPPSVWIIYTHPNGAGAYAKFDGITLERVIQQRLHACGLVQATQYEAATMVLLVHCPATEKGMGDYCENEPAQLEATLQYEVANNAIKQARYAKKPVVIADVASANGGDIGFYETVLLQQDAWTTWLYGYAGWNTPGNAIGSTLAMATVRLRAEVEGSFNLSYFQQLLAIRLADDIIYQAKVRQQLRILPPEQQLNVSLLNKLLAADVAIIQQQIDLKTHGLVAHFPCNRTFEVGFTL